MQKGREDELAKEAVLEWCVQILQQARKIMSVSIVLCEDICV